MSPAPRSPITVLKGADDVLLGRAVTDLIDELVGDADRFLMVEELGIDAHLTVDEDAYDIGRVMDAARTPPFLTERRIVLVRNAAVFSTKELVAPLVEHLADPLDTTILVLIWEKDPRPGHQGAIAPVPRSLVDAISGAGGQVIDTGAGRGQERSRWLADQVSASSLRLDPRARARLEEHLGEDMGGLPGILTTLEGVFGPGATLGVDDIAPFLGQAGDVAPWDLTDAIDRADVPGALAVLDRMLAGGDRHPLQVLATLTTHYLRMLEVDSPDIRGEKMAAERLGITGKQSTFPARKALTGAQRLGSERLAQFVSLLAEADLHLHGARSWPPELVVEVLVARLAGRSRGAGARR